MENITLYYEPLGDLYGKTYYHISIVYTDSTGAQYLATAQPTEDPSYNALAAALASAVDVKTGQPSPFGVLSGYAKPLATLSQQEQEHWLGTAANPYQTETVATGADLSQQWQSIETAYSQVDSGNFGYSPITQNSNSTAITALISAGITPPGDNGVGGSYWAPGAGNVLPIPAALSPLSTTADPDPTIETVAVDTSNPNDTTLLITDKNDDGAAQGEIQFSSNSDGVVTSGYIESTSGGGTTETISSQFDENSDGSSTLTVFKSDGSSTTTTYSGPDESGSVTSLDQENANGTSALTDFKSDGSSTMTNYSGPDGTGSIIGIDQQNADGTSAVTAFSSDGSSFTIRYSDPETPNVLTSSTSTSADGSSDTTTYGQVDGRFTILGEDKEAADGTSSIIVYNPDGSSSTIDYGGPNGTGGIIDERSVSVDGTSTITTNNPDGTSTSVATDLGGDVTTTDYSQPNGAGTISSQIEETTSGTSIITAYNPDGTSTATTYSGPDGTGTVTQTTTNNIDGTSTVTEVNGSETITYDYSEYNATGAITSVGVNSPLADSLTTYKADGTSTTDFELPNGTSSFTTRQTDGSYTTTNYSGPDETGNITQTEEYSADGSSSKITQFESDGTIITTTRSNGSITSVDQENPDGSSAVTTDFGTGSKTIDTSADGTSTTTYYDGPNGTGSSVGAVIPLGGTVTPFANFQAHFILNGDIGIVDFSVGSTAGSTLAFYSFTSTGATVNNTGYNPDYTEYVYNGPGYTNYEGQFLSSGDSIYWYTLPIDDVNKLADDYSVTPSTPGIYTAEVDYEIVNPSLAYPQTGPGSETIEFVVVGPNDATPCYCPNTLIMTDRGEIPVQHLQIGTIAITASGHHSPIRWIGRRSYAGAFIASQHLMLPICFKKDSLANGVPHSDLHVSPGHAMIIDGQLIPAWRLVNGVSVVQATAVDEVTYFHIELDHHDLLIANGAAAESFLDETGFRGQFHNAAEFAVLYPDVSETLPLQARLEDGFGLQRIQERLAARAGILPSIEPAGALRGYLDQAGPVRVCGWALDVDSPEEPVALEVLVDGVAVLCTLANGYRADLRKVGLGSGCHAFDMLLSREFTGHISVRRATDAAVLALTDTATRGPLGDINEHKDTTRKAA